MIVFRTGYREKHILRIYRFQKAYIEIKHRRMSIMRLRRAIGQKDTRHRPGLHQRQNVCERKEGDLRRSPLPERNDRSLEDTHR